MKKGITTDVLFWVIVFFIVFVVFVGLAMWGMGLGLDFVTSIFNWAP